MGNTRSTILPPRPTAVAPTRKLTLKILRPPRAQVGLAMELEDPALKPVNAQRQWLPASAEMNEPKRYNLPANGGRRRSS